MRHAHDVKHIENAVFAQNLVPRHRRGDFRLFRRFSPEGAVENEKLPVGVWGLCVRFRNYSPGGTSRGGIDLN